MLYQWDILTKESLYSIAIVQEALEVNVTCSWGIEKHNVPLQRRDFATARSSLAEQHKSRTNEVSNSVRLNNLHTMDSLMWCWQNFPSGTSCGFKVLQTMNNWNPVKVRVVSRCTTDACT